MLPPFDLSSLPRHVFFTGKGGVGKTSLSCSTAIALAKLGRKVFLVSTSLASNLDEILGLPKLDLPTPLPSVRGLTAMKLDPTRAGQLYRERILAPLKNTVAEADLKEMEDAMSGACTMEVAALDEFVGLFQDEGSTEAGGFTAGYDHVVFDTAPTGHTLRLLSLPAAWNSFLDNREMGKSCLGPSSAMKMNHSRFARALQCLTNSSSTVVILVARPDNASLQEAARCSKELAEMNLKNQQLIINGVFQAVDPTDEVATRMQALGQQALAAMDPDLRAMLVAELPLQPFNMVGLDRLSRLFEPPAALSNAEVPPLNPSPGVREMLATPLAKLVDEIAAPGNGLVLVMGKGGVGKTTTAACIAVELATRGYPVHLSTTDPAAHVADTLAGEVDGPLTVSRIDPHAETEAYIADIMAKCGPFIDNKARALMLEDLCSPCTEEVAVFQAFQRVIRQSTSRFVILDTAATGHTLLLLDQAGAYLKETRRVAAGGPTGCCAPGAQLSGCGPTATGGCRSSPQALAPSAASPPANGCTPGACLPGTCGLPVNETEGPSPLDILRDAERTRILLVTLPETTPISEAAALQEDLRRAGIEPYGWVVNGALGLTETNDPLLRFRAAAECQQLERLGAGGLAKRVALMPFFLELPVAPTLLLRQNFRPFEELEQPENLPDPQASVLARMSWVDRLLSLWILLAVAIGIGLSFIPSIRTFLTVTTAVGGTNIPLAIGLILMMYPPLARVDYTLIPKLISKPRMIIQSLLLNWIIGPLLMMALGMLIMGPQETPYVQGIVLIGIARCIAMVLVWNSLSGGDNNVCAMLVGMNSILQILLYAVYASVFTNSILPLFGFVGENDTQRVTLLQSFLNTLQTVAIYLGIPFAMAMLSWIFIRRYLGDERYYNGYCKKIGPITLIALLFAIVVMFAMQGVSILRTPLVVLWVAAPLLVYFFIMFTGSFLISWKMGQTYEECATMAFTAAGNNFELALAVSISVYKPNSPQAFTCIIGPLVEIPVMLALVHLAFFFRRRLTFTSKVPPELARPTGAP